MLRHLPDTEKLPLTFSTKARNLISVAPVLTGASVPNTIVFTRHDFETNSDACVSQAMTALKTPKYAVRSSCILEDAEETSNAGAFLSLLNVEDDGLETAINAVFGSYPHTHSEDEVMLQPMVADVICSGVAFSCDPETSAPYVTINFSTAGDTDAVTSGAKEGANAYYWHRSGHTRPDEQFEAVIALLQELEGLFDHKFLDIEFAITSDNTLHLLQVRPVTTVCDTIETDAHTQLLSDIEQQFTRCNIRNPFLLGDRAVFGLMPDWNPAEIIGPRPTPFALSLYRCVITDSIWAYQRNNYGYRNLRSNPLLVDFLGIPYVDVRVSFNSFLPKNLREEIAEKLTNHYLDTLVARPELHDKVEFEIVLSCFSFDIDQKLSELPNDLFTKQEKDEIKQSLTELTANIIHSEHALWKKDLKKLDTLAERRETILNSQADIPSKIYWLLEDCKRYGTLPFAGLARAAFIAVRILRSLEQTGIFTGAEVETFLQNVNTVSSDFMSDHNHLPEPEFIEKYGHLRPGTYDIQSPTYEKGYDQYFGKSGTDASHTADEEKAFKLSVTQLNALEDAINKHHLPFSAIELLNFLSSSIEAREYAKFEFTKNLSIAIELFAELGETHGYSRKELSYASINTVYEIYRSCRKPEKLLKTSIKEGRKKYAQGKHINLPALIWEPQQVWHYVSPVTRGNFVTDTIVIAETMSCELDADLSGKIVKILNTDPGYDWIFSRQIAGFITAYGGVNSHMAIRARELNVPAAIGIGETHYNSLVEGKITRLDCSSEIISHVE